MEETFEQAAVNTLRVLSAEAIAQAASGHTGIALGAAPIMYAIYKNMKFDPTDGGWFNRDRFVLSAGHGSALLYATLYAFGFNGIDLKTFRQFGSLLTGHPELDEKIGVDCSTGPLGQGLAIAVGIAAAEKRLAAMFNKKEIDIINHYTFCLVGDGCLMEGASYEACNLAGLWRLNKLIVLYDSNEITLDGERVSADIEDIVARFESMRWNVLVVRSGNDEKAISARIRKAMTFTDAPTIIIVETEIGFGAKNAGSNKAHGQVLTLDEIAVMREKWNLSSDHFEMDKDITDLFTKLIAKKKGLSKKWHKLLNAYSDAFPKNHKHLCEFIEKPQKDFTCKAKGQSMATRDAGGIMLNQIARQTGRLWGGSADVASTTKAFIEGGTIFSHKKLKGENIAFGVRELAMSAICNGLALHGFTPYCSTFLCFSDFCRPAMRLSALMNLPVTYIFSHDGLGNPPDGPTHQATEHIAALRLIPNMNVFRPASDFETAAVYEYVFEQQKPASIILGRGIVPNFDIDKRHESPQTVLLASGGEVSLCIEVQKILFSQGYDVNVISVPCLELFDAKELDPQVPVVAVEMGSGTSWWAFIGKNRLRGDVVSFDRFGESGKESDLREKLGFTVGQIAERVIKIIS